VEVYALPRTKNLSSEQVQEHLQGQLPQAYKSFPTVIPDLVLHPGCSFAGTEKSVGGRDNHRRDMEEFHTKAGFRMGGVRSICELCFLFS
jgi:hypothetical protein